MHVRSRRNHDMADVARTEPFPTEFARGVTADRRALFGSGAPAQSGSQRVDPPAGSRVTGRYHSTRIGPELPFPTQVMLATPLGPHDIVYQRLLVGE